MLEDPHCPIHRDLQLLSEAEIKNPDNNVYPMEMPNSKRPLEDEEDLVARKAAKTLEAQGEETVDDLDVLCLAQMFEDQSDKEENDHLEEMDMLIPRLGRDISIDCLLRTSRFSYGVISLLNKSFCSIIRSGELYRLRRKMGIVEHSLYFSCNLLEWDVFDPINLRWTGLPKMCTNSCFMCADKESLAVGTELLVFGRDIMSYIIYKYSILTNTWSIGMSLNTPRCLFGSASLGAIAIIAGGCDPHGKLLKSAELYDSEAGTWEPIPSMNATRKGCSGVFMDGKFYVIGGIGEPDNKVLTSAEVYDPITRTWTEIPNMFPVPNVVTAASAAPPLVAVVNNELYAAYHAQNEVKKYIKERNSWITLGSLPEDVVSMNGWGLAFRGCGNKVIVIGGPRSMGGGLIQIYAWVPNEGPPQWEVLGQKNSGCFVYNCAVMGC